MSIVFFIWVLLSFVTATLFFFQTLSEGKAFLQTGDIKGDKCHLGEGRQMSRKGP